MEFVVCSTSVTNVGKKTFPLIHSGKVENRLSYSEEKREILLTGLLCLSSERNHSKMIPDENKMGTDQSLSRFPRQIRSFYYESNPCIPSCGYSATH